MNTRLYFSLVTMEMRKILAYKVDFWLSSLSFLVVRFVIMYFLFEKLFQERTELRGFTFAGINLYVFLAAISRKITMGNADGCLNDDIYSGSLSKYLTMPCNLFSYKYSIHLAEGVVAFVQLALGLCLYVSVFGINPIVELSMFDFLLSLVAVLLGSVLYFFISVVIDSIAFFSDGIWGLHVVLRNCTEVLGGATIPLALFGSGFGELLGKLPFYFIGGFPVEIALGKMQAHSVVESFGYLLFWIFSFYIASKLIFRAGLKTYSGVGM
jgi:ABC-2 type transport system permease protein